MTSKLTFTQLKIAVPESAFSYLHHLLSVYPIQLKIVKPRKTKLGDYRYYPDKKKHQITINSDLNPYSFTITLVHEIAHYLQFKNNKRRGLAPHGTEWKSEYKALLEPLVSENIFPIELKPHLLQHLNKPKASSCADQDLMIALSQYDTERPVRLNDLQEGALFKVENRLVLRKGLKRRTRYSCQEINTKKTWFVHGLAVVEELTSTSENLC